LDQLEQPEFRELQEMLDRQGNGGQQDLARQEPREYRGFKETLDQLAQQEFKEFKEQPEFKEFRVLLGYEEQLDLQVLLERQD
jgi:hypothetical protein